MCWSIDDGDKIGFFAVSGSISEVVNQAGPGYRACYQHAGWKGVSGTSFKG